MSRPSENKPASVAPVRRKKRTVSLEMRLLRRQMATPRMPDIEKIDDNSRCYHEQWVDSYWSCHQAGCLIDRSKYRNKHENEREDEESKRNRSKIDPPSTSWVGVYERKDHDEAE